MQQAYPVCNGAFLFISGHKPNQPNAQLSNWFPLGFYEGATWYPTAEHYMMARKAELFGDNHVRGLILLATSPKEAKALGRKVKNFNEQTWIEHRESIMLDALRAKAANNPIVREFILNSGNTTIAEAAPWDRIWGIGLGPTDPAAMDPTKWKGLNLLGRAYMRLRDELRR
jgi:ribA/ribD-fused uncharacterized protein